MSRRLLISALPGETRSAWLEDGVLVDLLVSRADRPSLLGNLYLGRVAKVDRGLDGAFVEVGLARQGFLPLTEGPGKRLLEGDSVAVRVLREPSGDKGVRLTARLRSPPADLAERVAKLKPPALLSQGDDPLERLLAQGAKPEEIVIDDPATFAAFKARLGPGEHGLRLDNDPLPLFEREEIEHQIDALLATRVELPEGGFLLIEPVTTLTAVDVNSGARRRRETAEEMALASNLAAASALPRQLRLRALSGLIVIDFLALGERAHRAKVVARLRAGLKGDPEPGRVQPMAPSGLVELTRRRARPALHELYCQARGPIKSPVTLAYEALRLARREGQGAARLTLLATPDVVRALEGPLAEARRQVESRLGGPLTLTAEPGAPGSPPEVRPQR
ncbi:MAG: ribonuclease E/G [Pseudomonadota bacterium]